MTAPAQTKPLVIELTHTADDRNGPCPPIGDGWVVVRRAEGHTLWRRISCATGTPPSVCAGLLQGGMHQTRKGN